MSVTLISVSQDTVVSNKHEERTRHYYVIFPTLHLAIHDVYLESDNDFLFSSKHCQVRFFVKISALCLLVGMQKSLTFSFYPEVDRRVSKSPPQSVSEYATKPDPLAPPQVMQRSFIPRRYCTIQSAFCRCSSDGFEENCDILITEKAMSGHVPSIIYNSDPMTD